MRYLFSTTKKFSKRHLTIARGWLSLASEFELRGEARLAKKISQMSNKIIIMLFMFFPCMLPRFDCILSRVASKC